MAYFDHQEILRLASAATDAGLDDQRRALFAGLDPHWLSSMPTSTTLASQTLQDLTSLNDAETAKDSPPPMALWLANAIHLSRHKPDARQVLEAALRKAFPTFQVPAPLQGDRLSRQPMWWWVGLIGGVIVAGALLGVLRPGSIPASGNGAQGVSVSASTVPPAVTATAVLSASERAPASATPQEPPPKKAEPVSEPPSAPASTGCLVTVESAPPSWWLRCMCDGREARPPSMAASLLNDPGSPEKRKAALLAKAAASGWTCP